MNNFKLLRQGAEAKLYQGTYLGQEALVKERFSKKYRLPELDERLTRERMKAEARAIIKCKTLGIKTPNLYLVHQDKLIMQYINCPTARDYIRDVLNNKNTVDEAQKEILLRLGLNIGTILAKLHNNNVIHGDMTTSNLLVDAANDHVYVIDFGLTSTEGTPEDKGVDLYVLERALISAHPNTEFLFNAILQSYEDNLNKKSREAVMKKYAEIRLRGRKRDMVG